MLKPLITFYDIPSWWLYGLYIQTL